MTSAPGPSLRVAEVVAALSVATDLGTGMPQDRALRACLLAVRFGQVIGLGQPELAQTYYLSQLAMLGCTADSTTSAAVFGDELSMGPKMAPLIYGPQRDMGVWIMRNVGAVQPPLQRVRAVARLMAYGAGSGRNEGSRAHCEVAQHLAARLGLPEAVLDTLGYTFERWDGTGVEGLKGEAIPVAVRIAHLAWDIETGERLGGAQNCLDLVQRHAGSGLDPNLAERFCRDHVDVLAALEVQSFWEAVLAEEPEPSRSLSGDEIDAAASIFADFADMKSAFTSEHSRRVAALAADAARRSRLGQTDIELVYRAGLVHDVGRVSVSTNVWDRQGPLRDPERERVRLHAYHTERVLYRAGALADAGILAGLHHERLDGSGYHRGAHASTLSTAARILAAADAFAAMTEPRAYRTALEPEQAEQQLTREAAAGHLDSDAVRAVLGAAGQRIPRQKRDWAGGLSGREVEVLGLLARGLSMKEIAQRLVVSPKTVDHHVQHIYTKLDIRTRPAARLFAMEHGLVYEGPLV